MLTEDYCNFDIAKLLKEKGFPQDYDEYRSLVYNGEDYEDEYEIQRMVLQTRLVKAGTLSSYPIGVPEPKYYCPTIQMAMKWLREVHNLHIGVYRTACGYFYIISRVPTGSDLYFDGFDYEGDDENSGQWTTYEKACEAAIKYCLENLI